MLTKGSFTHDEWNHLLLLLNIMNFSIFCCCHFLQTESKVPCQKEDKKVTSEEGSPMEKETDEFGDSESETYEFGVAEPLE